MSNDGDFSTRVVDYWLMCGGVHPPTIPYDIDAGAEHLHRAEPYAVRCMECVQHVPSLTPTTTVKLPDYRDERADTGFKHIRNVGVSGGQGADK